jgi:hypothetical protein
MRKSTPKNTDKADSKGETDEAAASLLLLKETDEYLKGHMQWKKEHEQHNIELQAQLAMNTAPVEKKEVKYEESEESKHAHQQFNSIMEEYQQKKPIAKKLESVKMPVKVEEKDYSKLKTDVEVNKYMQANYADLQKKLTTENDMLKDLELLQSELQEQTTALDDVIGRIDNCAPDKSSIASKINSEYDDIKNILKHYLLHTYPTI